MTKRNKSFYDEVMRMERARTGNYGMDIGEYIPPRCPICKTRTYDYIVRNKEGKICGCEECITKDYDWDGEIV